MDSPTQETDTGITLWMPTCEEDVKPKLDMVFNTLEEGKEFYKIYARKSGFSVRLHAKRMNIHGRITKRFMCCTREKFHKSPTVIDDITPKMKVYKKVIKKQRKITSRMGCKANFVMELTIDGKYELVSWREGHTHQLATPKSPQFLAINREMTVLQKKFVTDCSKNNIGHVLSYRLFKNIVGGYENIGSTKIDFKNFQRDLKTYIGGSDAQMVIDNFFAKKEMWSAFYFDYDVDEEDHLTRLFWADPMARKNFACFGDVIPFDTTYRTNKYKLIFGPFSGVDNHKKCICFGAGFLAKEDSKSFEWIFKRFVDAMGYEPSLIITDQDPTMKVAIEKIFKQAKHRFCMWHIMTKLPNKVGTSLCTKEFISAINKCVWDNFNNPAEFERKWVVVISVFNMSENGWLSHLYDIGKFWIPAYYRDVFMGGLLQTTSRSESEDSFFNRFTNTHLTLVEFMMRFDSAMDAQRHTQAQLNYISYTTVLGLETPLKMEREATEVYTQTVFFEVQKEILAACYSVRIDSFSRDGDTELYELGVKNREEKDRKFRVVYTSTTKKAKCSCMRFEQFGIPCKHMCFVYKGEDILPRSCILPRWTKDATKNTLYDIETSILSDSEKMQKNKMLLNELWSEINSRVVDAERNDDINGFLEHIRAYKVNKNAENDENRNHKNSITESIIGTSAPKKIKIHVPEAAKTKGSELGGRKRILGGKEIATKKAEKKKKTREARESTTVEKTRNKRLCGYAKNMHIMILETVKRRRLQQIEDKFYLFDWFKDFLISDLEWFRQYTNKHVDFYIRHCAWMQKKKI